MATQTISDKAMAHRSIKNVIDEQVGNLTLNHFRTDKSYRAVKKTLESFARKVAELAMRGNDTMPNFDLKDWREDFANRTNNSLIEHGVEALICEISASHENCFPRKIGRRAGFKYVYWKIAAYTAQVSRMLLNRLDPNMLTMSDEEMNEYQAKMIEIALSHNKEVILVAV